MPIVPTMVQVGGRAKASDQRDGAAVTFVCLQPGAVQQMARDQALHHLQHWSDQLGLRGQQHAQRGQRIGGQSVIGGCGLGNWERVAGPPGKTPKPKN